MTGLKDLKELKIEGVKANELRIPLINGEITGKSKLDLKKLAWSMEKNLRHKFVNIILFTIGLRLKTTQEGINLEMINQPALEEYIAWDTEKKQYYSEKEYEHQIAEAEL